MILECRRESYEKVNYPFNLNLTDLLTDDLRAKIGPAVDVGANVTDELGGIVTCEGISADRGHYLAWVRCDATKANPNFHQASPSQASPEESEDPGQQEWYLNGKFLCGITYTGQLHSTQNGIDDADVQRVNW
ncbi:uncharacterized protein MELLADRAFT_108130 [Melampsora larici-populina 98AG31]|uniref:Uncharacterized protein n=1 Tax=Melampsora larici-populina (strain 98AG31 / pathotype 3-4-7) TaxID=747676 RepID=F4RS24_MELLP|nr:uncharacterized protein MELLADRAFT_108130 [Melampsora larici-populina 98AG31]EGG04853.1 hypothetical protein MELLADRAFT_108130 [Melampsora larici-populina 98AG31]